MISAVLFVSFFVFLIMGVPIAICLGLSSVCAILYSGTSLTIVATNMYAESANFCFWQFRFLYFPEISWRKPEFPKDLLNSLTPVWDTEEAVLQSYALL